MSTHNIGFLHPGEMGISLISSASMTKQNVYWCSAGRSKFSVDRVESLASPIQDTSNLIELCQRCDIIISVCPPHAAYAQAIAVINAKFRGIYVDVNAISPDTANSIMSKMNEAQIDFVDGGIIGLPPTKKHTTWLYLSGEKANIITQCFELGLFETVILGASPGQASALKMCFAANSKGATAMLTAILSAAEFYGVRDTLEKQWNYNDPELTLKNLARIQNVARKAWRFTGEMEEIAQTLKGAGMPTGFHLAAAEIYSKQQDYKTELNSPELEDIIKKCLSISNNTNLE